MGGQTGKSSGSSSSAAGRVATAGGTKLFNEANPVLKQLLQQMQQVLQGNLYGPTTIPLIQNAVGAARQATSTASQGADAYLSRIGADRSPFAAAIQSNIQQQGAENVAQQPVNIAEQFLGMIPGVTGNTLGEAFGGLSTGTSSGSQQQSGKGGNINAQGIGSILSAAGGLF
jgi:hypothetical protein